MGIREHRKRAMKKTVLIPPLEKGARGICSYLLPFTLFRRFPALTCSRVILFSLVSVLLCSLVTNGDAAGSPLAVLSKTEGRVRVMRSGAEKWKKAGQGVFLYEGDSIKTGKKSKAVINFISGIEIDVNSNTEFKINMEEEKGKKKEELDLIMGEILSKVQKGTDYRVKTPQAVTAVRGTKFGVVAGAGQTSVYVLDGTVDVYNDFGTVSCGKGEKTSVGSGAAPAPPEEMEEEEIEEQSGWQEPEKEEIELKVEINSGKGLITGVEVEVVITADKEYEGKIEINTTPDDFEVTRVEPWAERVLKFYCIKTEPGQAVININNDDVKTIIMMISFDEPKEKKLSLELDDGRKLELKFTK